MKIYWTILLLLLPSKIYAVPLTAEEDTDGPYYPEVFKFTCKMEFYEGKKLTHSEDNMTYEFYEHFGEDNIIHNKQHNHHYEWNSSSNDLQLRGYYNNNVQPPKMKGYLHYSIDFKFINDKGDIYYQEYMASEKPSNKYKLGDKTNMYGRGTCVVEVK